MAKNVEVKEEEEWEYGNVHPRLVNRKKAEGWEVVEGDGPDGLHRIGDGVTMRMPRKKLEALQAGRKRPYNLLSQTIAEGKPPVSDQGALASLSMTVKTDKPQEVS